MFFEDEKDIIREDADIRIDEDGTVTWEDVLNTDEDIQISNIRKNKVQSKQTMINTDDELQFEEKEIDDKEIINIINDTQADTYKTQSNTYENVAENNISDEFDIDSQLANVVLEQNTIEDNPLPRKNEKKKSSSGSPALLLLLFIAIIGGAAYYGINYFQENAQYDKFNQNELPPKHSIQEELNNTTQEEIKQRQITQENIPVVSEDEANEVKPEEKEETKEEKKQVIKVVPTGRSHPFMPIAKYATTDIPDASILYDKSGVPKPPSEYGIPEEETVQLMTIAVSGIMYDEIKPSAIITYDNNDYFVQKGDKLDNYKIIEIAKNHVTIALGPNTYRANIGEEFKIDSRFEGSAQFMSKNEGGGKQYYSVNSEKNRTKSNTENLRYVSEEDITINTK